MPPLFLIFSGHCSSLFRPLFQQHKSADKSVVIHRQVCSKHLVTVKLPYATPFSQCILSVMLPSGNMSPVNAQSAACRRPATHFHPPTHFSSPLSEHSVSGMLLSNSTSVSNNMFLIKAKLAPQCRWRHAIFGYQYHKLFTNSSCFITLSLRGHINTKRHCNKCNTVNSSPYHYWT